MKIKHLILCDDEYAYVNSLMENILEREELAVKVSICTNPESARQVLSEQTVDMVLIAKEWTELLTDVFQDKQVMVFSENRYAATEERYPSIFKYQSADNIVAMLFEQTGVYQKVREDKQQILAVYSPVHRCGRTTLAMELSRIYQKEKKTLYLNLEEYPGMAPCERELTGANLGDFFYYMKQEGADSGLRLSAMVRESDGISYLAPMMTCRDLKEITATDWKFLLEELEKSNYEVIVLDVGESIQGLMDVLELCDRIYMPELEDTVSQAKVRIFFDELSVSQYSTLEQKIRKVCAPEYDSVYVSGLIGGDDACDSDR